MSGSTEPDNDLNNFLEDIFKNINKKNPSILLFSNQNSNIKESKIFKNISNFSNNLFLIENDSDNLRENILKSDRQNIL